jgi:hypothetical protein
MEVVVMQIVGTLRGYVYVLVQEDARNMVEVWLQRRFQRPSMG